MNTQNTLFVNSNSSKHKTTYAQVDSLTLPERRELLLLLNTSYPDWGMNRIFEDYPCYKSLYIFRLWIDSVLIASRQILIVDSIEKAPEWSQDMARILSIKRFAIGSRAIVHPGFRNQGLGSYLVRRVNHDAYARHDLDTMFGSSTSIAAISLYLRLGARLWGHDINRMYLHDSNTSRKATYNKLLINNNERYLRMGHPQRYVYYRHVMDNTWDKYLWSQNRSERKSDSWNA